MWNVLISLFLLQGLYEINAASVQPLFTCPSEEGFYANPGECSPNYWACFGGVAYPQTCPGVNYVFDPANGRCVPYEQSSCKGLTTSAGSPTTTTTARTTTTTSPTTTTTRGTGSTTTVSTTTRSTSTTTKPSGSSPCITSEGFFPIPGTCGSDYYICIQGAPYVATCPNGAVFDPETLICTSPEEASCAFRCPTPDGFFPIDPAVCDNKFYTCVKDVATLTSCPGSSLFDPNVKSCVNKDLCKPITTSAPVVTTTTSTTTTTTTRPTTTTAAPFSCPGTGNYEYAPCSNLYYVCSGSTYIIATCPSNYVFDPNVKYCVPIANAEGCGPFSDVEYQLSLRLVGKTGPPAAL